jgi:hypothetical protein
MEFLIASATPPSAIGLLLPQAPKRLTPQCIVSTIIIAPIASLGLEPSCVRAVSGATREQ